MSKTFPLHELHTKAGAEFTSVRDWTTPNTFGDAVAEYRDAYERAALFDVSNRGKVRLSGKEAIQFLHNFCSNDIIDLKPGTGCEAFLTTAKARLIAPINVSRLGRPDGDELLLDTCPDLSENVIGHLSKYRITEQVEFTDRSSQLAQFYLCGPESVRIGNAVFGESVNGLGEFQHADIAEDDEPNIVRRHDFFNLPGFEIICSVDQAAESWSKLVEQGATPAGTAAYEMLRIEAGLPSYGREMDENRLVTEVGRTEQAISYTKGCYLGQETIIMARDRGHVNRKLMGLKLAGKDPVSADALVKVGEDTVGQVTSSVFSPRLDQAIALAFLKRGHQTAGTEVTVESNGTTQTGSICDLPIIR